MKLRLPRRLHAAGHRFNGVPIFGRGGFHLAGERFVNDAPELLRLPEDVYTVILTRKVAILCTI